MSTQEIDKKIASLKEELDNVKGTPCEMYSRIVGFYRSVRNWNAGKKEEYASRKEFALPPS